MLNQKQLGEKFKEIRNKLGFSQDFIAKELGINRQAIIAIESGSRKIDSFELFKVAKLFNLNAEDLLTEKKFESQKLQQALTHFRNNKKLSEEGIKSLNEFQKICEDFNFLKSI